MTDAPTNPRKSTLYLYLAFVGALIWSVSLGLAYLENSIPLDIDGLPMLERMFFTPAGLIATIGASILIVVGVIGFFANRAD
ncbi:MAG: hypothetical protein ACK5JT_00430 [Hyphomicrobiaceae bacterium]